MSDVQSTIQKIIKENPVSKDPNRKRATVD